MKAKKKMSMKIGKKTGVPPKGGMKIKHLKSSPKYYA